MKQVNTHSVELDQLLVTTKKNISKNVAGKFNDVKLISVLFDTLRVTNKKQNLHLDN